MLCCALPCSAVLSYAGLCIGLKGLVVFLKYLVLCLACCPRHTACTSEAACTRRLSALPCETHTSSVPVPCLHHHIFTTTPLPPHVHHTCIITSPPYLHLHISSTTLLPYLSYHTFSYLQHRTSTTPQEPWLAAIAKRFPYAMIPCILLEGTHTPESH